MKPVNLMPAAGRRAGGGGAGGATRAYAVLGALLGVLALVALFVHASNGATERRNQAAELDAESGRLEAQARTAPSQVSIADVRRRRTESVRALAGARLDWERLVLETARLVPSGVWLTSFEASAGVSTAASPGTAPAAGQPAGASPAAGTGAASAAAAPTVSLGGCSRDHARVADLLVRLRRVHGARDVELLESGKDMASGAVPGAGATAGSSGCDQLSFKLTITLTPPAQQAAVTAIEDRVPASLGGGQ